MSDRPEARDLEPAANADPFQVMPPLTSDEYDALVDDIRMNGVLSPILIDQYGRIIDGHHRKRACDELGIDCPTEVRPIESDEQARQIALTLNLTRRQLTQQQRAELIVAELQAVPHHSDRAIARCFGCSPSTVGKYRAELSRLDTERAEAERRDQERRQMEAAREAIDTVRRMCEQIVALGVLIHKEKGGGWPQIADWLGESIFREMLGHSDKPPAQVLEVFTAVFGDLFTYMRGIDCPCVICGAGGRDD